MVYAINAWLDCPQPQVTVFNTQSGVAMLTFEGDELEELIESGELYQSDLESNDPRLQMEIIRELALYRCLREQSYSC